MVNLNFNLNVWRWIDIIGLVDLDLQQSTSKTLLVPNLEIMKLATYYRVEENKFCRLIDLDEQELSSYDIIYFFSEQRIQPEVPPQFMRANNVIFGGTAFTNGIYKPFENEIIDFTIARPHIYKEFLKDKYNDGIKTSVIAHVLDDSYYRNYAGENKLPLSPVKHNKRFFLYDKNFFYSDWEDTIQEITNRKCSSIIRIHPIVCTTLSQYFRARSFQKLSRSNEYILDLEIPLNEVNYLINHYKNQFLADIVKDSNVFIPLKSSKYTKLQYANELLYRLHLLFSYWGAGILLRFKYISTAIGYMNPYEELFQFIEQWADITRPRKTSKTIIEWVPKNKKYNNLREQIEQVIKIQPELNTVFNQTYENIKEKGAWHI